ncbi:cytidylate kinase-like family protein [Intestinibacillus massiliensis]|uniref:cytidylate kinase-like family protein n=1 Tax=Intestinibacillus massiliensis TaxID=1871029 RepID=UPI000B363944|nr:cytidylate kinase-like family protein [Intestinibacillus massiliensis]MCB6365561.1 cytidylate kinase-like family protein [Intestinibacillus massiliensis]
MTDNMIITISREYGTGGREVGKKLAERLGIAYYDREIIARAAKKTGFSEELFDQLDKRATNSFLYSLTMFGSTGSNGMTLTDQLFLAQCKIIREVADDGPCVIVGRCADHVLREYPNRYDFFIHGDLEARIHRIQTCGDYEISGKTPQAALEKMDKQRSTYYNYYTGKVWGKCDHYDLCVNAGRIGVDKSVDVIMHYIDAVRK